MAALTLTQGHTFARTHLTFSPHLTHPHPQLLPGSKRLLSCCLCLLLDCMFAIGNYKKKKIHRRRHWRRWEEAKQEAYVLTRGCWAGNQSFTFLHLACMGAVSTAGVLFSLLQVDKLQKLNMIYGLMGEKQYCLQPHFFLTSYLLFKTQIAKKSIH